jgi:hypothetical protein
VGRLIGGGALLLLALFMLFGFMRADIDASGAAKFFAFLVAVGLPAAGGGALILSHVRGKGQLAGRRAELRQKTLEAEILRLAAQQQGKITVVETVAALAVTPEEAKEALDALARRGLADFQVTDSGVIVYAFHDVEKLSEKSRARGLLE